MWTQFSERQFGADADAFGVLRWAPESFVGPRFVFGAGLAWNSIPTPRSFAIEHELNTAFGFHSTLGLGIERYFRQGKARWFIDIRGDVHTAFEHTHQMRDLRTGESINESYEVQRLSILLASGILWSTGL